MTSKPPVSTRKSSISPARTMALQLLQSTLGEGATLLDALAASGEDQLDPRNRSLAREIVLGTCRSLGRIRFVLGRFAPRWEKFPPIIQRILEASIYQLLYLERVPAYAVINDAVEMARSNKLGGLAKAVNGILRNVARDGDNVPLPAPEHGIVEYLSVAQSQPRWLVERWIALWGEERCASLCAYNNTRASLSLRVRGGAGESVEAAVASALQRLESMGKNARQDYRFPARIVLHVGEDTEPEFARHPEWAVQDGAAQLVALIAAPQPRQRIWDVCAAPGGKTLHLADLMRDEGEILATDRSPIRLERLRQTIRERGVSCVRAEVLDVLAQPVHLSTAEPFDLVLVDAPCTGWGTFRRHPDLRWRLRPEDSQRLGDQALIMLNSVCDYVKPGGALIYSTCTLSPEENEEAVRRFLHRRSDFALEPLREYVPPAFLDAVTREGWMSVFPPKWQLDGMFAARMRRRM